MANKHSTGGLLFSLLSKRLGDSTNDLIGKAREAIDDLLTPPDPLKNTLTELEEVGRHLDMDWQYTITGTPEDGYSCHVFGASAVVGNGENQVDALEDALIELGFYLTRQQRKVHGRY